MPASFSELLNNIELQNRANREQLWSQISPYLEVFTKQAYYEKEKRGLAEGLTTLAKNEGWNYQAPTVNGKLASPELIQAHYGSQQKIQMDRQATEQWYRSNNIPLPENWNNLTPQERSITKAKSENDFAYQTAIGSILEAYPEVKAKLPKDFASKPLSAQKAILDRRVPELREEGGAGEGMMPATYSEADSARVKLGEAQKSLKTLTSRPGKSYSVDTSAAGSAAGKTKANVRVAVFPQAGGALSFRFGDNSKVVKGTYYDASGKKAQIPPDKANVMQMAMDEYNDLSNKVANAEEEMIRSQQGIPRTGSGTDPLMNYSTGTF